AAVYALPDPVVGDQLVVSMTLRDVLTPQEWGAFLAQQPDLSTKSWPTQVFILEELPRTATNKIRKRDLQAMGTPQEGVRWVRPARGTTYAAV
ncbi:MAG TPA: acyl-CoA synthetase, partial [Marmoricola sp.]|nr:acyl-CoA synthetase [Marmoricola sp.]